MVRVNTVTDAYLSRIHGGFYSYNSYRIILVYKVGVILPKVLSVKIMMFGSQTLYSST